MITLFLGTLGLLAVRTLPIDLYPDVSAPVVTVRVSLPGAAPEEVEELIVRPLEDVLATLGGVKTLRAVAREGFGFVSLEFELDQNMDAQEAQVRAKVGESRRRLPEEIDEPTVVRQSLDDTPIIEAALTGPRTASELTDLAEDIVTLKLRQIEGVGEVNLSGTRTRVIKIELDPVRMANAELNASEVAAKLRQTIKTLPLGRLEGKERAWILRVDNNLKLAFHLRDLVVGRKGDFPVFLKDVAEVTESFNKATRFNRFFQDGQGNTSIGIEITKQSGRNTLDVANKVQQLFDALESELPEDTKLVGTADTSNAVRVNVLDVAETLLIAIVLTVAVVLLFLRSPRATLTTALSLPSSIITTFLAMQLAGFSINTMTLLALTLSIGIIVDDAIVVRENIHKFRSELNFSAKDAALKGTQQVALAVIATTLVLVAMFLPVAGMDSVTGQFFKPFALTVSFAVLVSLWDALTMAPLLSAYYANFADPSDEWSRFGAIGKAVDRMLIHLEHAFEKATRSYASVLTLFLDRVWLPVVVLALSLAAIYGGAVTVRKGFLPNQLAKEFRVSLDGPLAIPAEQVRTLLPKIESILGSNKDIETVSLSAGLGWSGAANVQLAVRTKSERARNQKQLSEVRQSLRQSLSVFPGYSVRVVENSDPLAGGGGPRFAPVLVNITGQVLEEINSTATRVQQLLASTAGLSDVSQAADEGLPELLLRLDPLSAGRVGLDPSLVVENVRTWVQGTQVLQLNQGGKEIPVELSAKDGLKMEPQDLMRQALFFGSGIRKASPLGELASLDAGAGPTTIQRENRQRVVRVFSGLEPGVALGDILTGLQEKISEIPKPSGGDVVLSGQSEQMSAFFAELGWALLLGSVFVYMVLASLFESWVHPLTVMMALPLAGGGALWSLWAFDVPFDLYGGIGIVLLCGLVAKNSILIVDLALQKVREGWSPEKALRETVPGRLRPIVMTSLAMVVGMLPIATGWGVAGSTRQALGIATIGGVISSTILSLLLIPSLFLWVEKGTAKLRSP